MQQRVLHYVWHSSLSQENIEDLEIVQKTAIKVILQTDIRDMKRAWHNLVFRP